MNSLSRKGPQGAVWAAPAPGQSSHGCGRVGVQKWGSHRAGAVLNPEKGRQEPPDCLSLEGRGELSSGPQTAL